MGQNPLAIATGDLLQALSIQIGGIQYSVLSHIIQSLRSTFSLGLQGSVLLSIFVSRTRLTF